MKKPKGGGIKTLFKDYAETWLKGKVKIKESSQVNYRTILDKYLIPHFGNAKISEIERQDIKDYVSEKVSEEKLSARRINNFLDVLYQILTEADVDGYIIRNPYVKIERARVEKKEADYLRSRDEIKAFLKSSETENYPFWYSGIFTGMRKNELTALRWGDIDWFNKKIYVRNSIYKGKFVSPKSESSVREIDMGQRLIEILKDHRIKQNIKRLKAGEKWNDMDLVFPNRKGTPLDGHTLHRDFLRILKRSGLRSMPIHSLRHTYASIMIGAGHNPKYIQSQMGHSSIKITLDLYGHLMKEVQKEAANQSEDFIFGHGLGTETVLSNSNEIATY
jgi:integrase